MGVFDFFSASKNSSKQQEEAQTYIQKLLDELKQKNALLDKNSVEIHNLECELMIQLTNVCKKDFQIHELEENLSCLEKKRTIASQNEKYQLELFLDNLNNDIQNLQQEMNTLKNENEHKCLEIHRLQTLYQPFLESKKTYDILLSQIELLKKHILAMEFFTKVKQYRMEKALIVKKIDCRKQYDNAMKDCHQKIQEYERDLGIDEYKIMRPYISNDEFSNLPRCQRNQLALSRYNAAPKTDYEVGLTYERFIGYLFELQDYEVRYHGALNKFKDKGIDLYALKKKEVLVIQCKRWSKDTIINEGTIIKLSGSMNISKNKFPKRDIKGILYTTTQVSDEAKKEALKLNIAIYENFAIKEYPIIKCNLSEMGEKIYHLPFDQQYDKTFITLSKGDFYATTVEEAENLGFRHAHKWKPEKKKH